MQAFHCKQEKFDIIWKLRKSNPSIILSPYCEYCVGKKKLLGMCGKSKMKRLSNVPC
jgi:hypothetical protein